MKARHSYTDEDTYKVLLVALKNPDGGYGGLSFWNSMILRYGGKFFGGKSASGLKQKWKNIRENHICDIGNYKKSLERLLGTAKVREIKDKINNYLNYDEDDEKNAKLKQEDPEQKQHWYIKDMKRKFCDRNHNSFGYEETGKGVGEDRSSGKAPSLIIDMGQLIPKPHIIQAMANEKDNSRLGNEEIASIVKVLKNKVGLLNFYRDFELGTIKIFASEEVPDEENRAYKRTLEIFKNLAKVYKRTPDELFKLYYQVSSSMRSLEAYLRGEKVTLWTEYEDWVLQHPEEEAHKKLEESKTAKEISDRKSYLQLS
eukprot:TRINITY_DN10571_c0_g1_i6.p1 TRINITY_DN10571_c0_g1~~TRINITY_DN10571_c0_g1_i6.p1  ORF type:complete len:314 (+),score=114.56 TRINITY_DN10571_c0_g1_i6:159-1100(+)